MRIPRWFVVPTLVITALAAALCFVPLFNVLAYEFCFAIGLLAGVTSITIGLAVARAREPRPSALLHALALATLHLLPALGLISLNAVRVKNCNMAQGLAFFALLPCCSAWYGATIGVLVGQLGKRATRFARAAAAGALLATSVGLSLWALYAEPSIVAYNHFLGHFAGSLYDEVIRLDARLIAFRCGTLARIALIGVVLWVRYCARTSLGHVALALALVAAMVLSAGYERIAGRRFGFRVTRSDVIEALPITESRPGIVVHLPDGLAPELRAAIADDHAFRLELIKKRLGVNDLPTIHSYVYGDAATKARLMGARGTMVSKPWLYEIHVHNPIAPHPVVEHELVHVVAAALAPPPLRVSSRFGVFVNMGLVEGLAEAITTPRGQLDGDAYARAMRHLNLAPNMRTILGGGGFWGAAPARAYTIAGSFVSYLLRTFGTTPLKKVYAHGNFEEAYGKPLEALIGEWEHYLDEGTLSSRELDITAEQFRTPAIFERTCAHEVAALREQAAHARAQEAVRVNERILHFLGNNVTALFDLTMALNRLDDSTQFTKHAEQLLKDPRISAAQRGELISTLGEVAWKKGERERATAFFEQGRDGALDPANQRLNWVRLWALQQSPEVAETLRTFLSQQPSIHEQQPQPIAALLRLSELMQANADDKTPPYLIARQLQRAGAHADALRYLKAAEGHPFGLIEAERRRLIADCDTNLGRLNEAINDWAAYAAVAPTSGEHSRAEDQIVRLRWQSQQQSQQQSQRH